MAKIFSYFLDYYHKLDLGEIPWTRLHLNEIKDGNKAFLFGLDSQTGTAYLLQEQKLT